MPWPQINVSLRCDSRGGHSGNQVVRFLRWWMAILSLFFLVGILTLGQTTPRKSHEADRSTGVGSSPESQSEQADPLRDAKSEANGGSLEKADRAVRNYLVAHPDSADGHFLLGLILFKQGKPTESLSEHTEGAKHHDPGAAELKIVALDYVLLGDYANADHWLTRSLEWNPKDSQGWYYLGRTKYTADALTAFHNAIAWQAQLLKKNSGPFINMGILLLEQNKVEEAVAYLSEAVEISPEESRAHEQLGKAYSRQNDLERAQVELEKAVSLTPDNAALHFMLGQLYRKRGMNEKARLELERGAALKASGVKPKPSPPD